MPSIFRKSRQFLTFAVNFLEKPTIFNFLPSFFGKKPTIYRRSTRHGNHSGGIHSTQGITPDACLRFLFCFPIVRVAVPKMYLPSSRKRPRPESARPHTDARQRLNFFQNASGVHADAVTQLACELPADMQAAYAYMQAELPADMQAAYAYMAALEAEDAGSSGSTQDYVYAGLRFWHLHTRLSPSRAGRLEAVVEGVLKRDKGLSSESSSETRGPAGVPPGCRV